MKSISKTKIILIVCMFLSSTSFAQTQQKPCSSDQATQFDFWVGTWDLEWTNQKGIKQKGTNIIDRILGGCVIEESFSTSGDNPYRGKSHSVFDTQSNMWRQTWVDNTGGYLDFVGEFKDGKMTLWREFLSTEGKKIKQRMIFSNIQKDSIEWNWESSGDDGNTWKTNWKIIYKRRK